MEFTNFKIEGRGLGSALILEFLLYYMTKPEYQINVREKIYLDRDRFGGKLDRTGGSKIFSFSLSSENLEILSKISEQYVLSRIQKRLPTLEFYKSVKF